MADQDEIRQPQGSNREVVALPALRWTGLLVWLGLLFACALSSIYLLVAIVQGSVIGGFQDIGGVTRLDEGAQRSVALAGFVLTLVAALSLLAAWYTVAKAAHYLIDDAVNGDGDTGAPEGWLRGAGPEPFSLPGAAAMFLGITWAVLLITSPLLAMMRVMLQD